MELFVRHLVKGCSQREAYRKAYPKCKAKDASVDSMAARLWAKVEIQSRYSELHAQVIEQTKKESIADATEVMESLTKIMRANILDQVEITTDRQGRAKIKMKQGADGMNIQSIATDKNGNIVVTMEPKIAAVRAMASILNLKEKDAAENNVTNEITVNLIGDLEEYSG